MGFLKKVLGGKPDSFNRQPPPYDQWGPGTLFRITGIPGDIVGVKQWKVKQGKWDWVELESVTDEGKTIHVEFEYDDGEWLITLWEEQIELPPDIDPRDPPKVIEYGGNSYRREEKGHGTYQLVTVGDMQAEAGEMLYFDYEVGKYVLSIEIYDEEYVEVWIGRSVKASLLEWIGQNDSLV